VINDLCWWNNTLSEHGRFCRILHLNLVNPNVFVDASTSWGIGIWFDGKWDAWKLSDNWKGPSQDIGWLEGITLEFIIYILAASDFSDARVTIHSDNKGVISAFDKGQCRNPEINLSIRRSATTLASHNLLPSLVHVNPEDNLADPISCGILGSPALRLGVEFNMPNELIQFFLHV
jgi:hypothetical protein